MLLQLCDQALVVRPRGILMQQPVQLGGSRHREGSEPEREHQPSRHSDSPYWLRCLSSEYHALPSNTNFAPFASAERVPTKGELPQKDCYPGGEKMVE